MWLNVFCGSFVFCNLFLSVCNCRSFLNFNDSILCFSISGLSFFLVSGLSSFFLISDLSFFLVFGFLSFFLVSDLVSGLVSFFLVPGLSFFLVSG